MKFLFVFAGVCIVFNVLGMLKFVPFLCLNSKQFSQYDEFALNVDQ